MSDTFAAPATDTEAEPSPEAMEMLEAAVSASLRVAFFDDAIVPPAIVLLDYALHHALRAEAMLDLPARLARLAHLEQGSPEAKAIPDEHVLFS